MGTAFAGKKYHSKACGSGFHTLLSKPDHSSNSIAFVTSSLRQPLPLRGRLSMRQFVGLTSRGICRIMSLRRNSSLSASGPARGGCRGSRMCFLRSLAAKLRANSGTTRNPQGRDGRAGHAPPIGLGGEERFGWAQDEQETICPACNGTGTILMTYSGYNRGTIGSEYERCDRCGGTGRL